MRLCELAHVVWTYKVLIFFGKERGCREFISTGWKDNDQYNAIRKACKEFGDRHIVCLYPLSQNELTITIE